MSSLAAGVIAASFAGGARLDLMGYLFGDILAVSKADIAWIWGGAAAVLAALFWLWRPLLAVTVNEELAAAEGVPVRRTETAFILLIAVTVALAMKVVGILLITSLMIFPTAVARPFSKTPEQMAALAGLAAAAAVLGGLYLSLRLDTAAGPSIVLALAALFFFVAAPALALAGQIAVPGLHPTGILYASCVWRHLCVNLSLTVSSAFLLLKDPRRNRLAGRLTRAPVRSNP